MQNAQQHSMKKECHSTNRFNDSEYNRWSQGLKAIQSSNPQCGIESFLRTTDSLQPEHANMCVPFDSDWQEMKKGRTTNMAWKLREWKRAVEQPLQHRNVATQWWWSSSRRLVMKKPELRVGNWTAARTALPPVASARKLNKLGSTSTSKCVLLRAELNHHCGE